MNFSTFMASAVAAALGPWAFAFVYLFAQSVVLLQQYGDFADFVASSAYAMLAVLVTAIILKGFDR